VATGLISCSGDDENAVIPKEEPNENDSLREVEVEFYLSTGSLTRSDDTYTEEDVEGSEWENYIDTSTLHLYLANDGSNATPAYVANNKNTTLSGTFLTDRDITITSVKRVNNSGTYKVNGKCTLPTSNFRVVAIANWPKAYTGTTANLNFNDLINFVIRQSATYEYNGDSETFVPSETNTFPMYGIKSYNFEESNFSGKKQLNLGTIDLVRAMAKIIVKASSETTITSATLTRCNSRGRCAPYQMYQNTIVPNEDLNNGLNNTINTLGLFTTEAWQEPVENVSFRQVNDSTYVVYVPEYFNNIPNGTWGYNETKLKTCTPTRIALTFSYKTTENGAEVTVDDPKTRYIDFKEDQDGDDYFSILRNHMYVFTVRYYKEEALNYYVENFDNFTAGKITFD
jgi:hypothetical protein